MNWARWRRSLGWSLAVLAFHLGLAAGEPTGLAGAVPETLNVRINVPPAWWVLGDERMGDVLAERASQVLLRAGCRCPVKILGLVDHPAAASYLLTIDLNEWRLDAAGYAHCSLAARLTTPQGTRDLGLYSSATMNWARGTPPFRLSSAFEEAAESAMERLAADLADSKLLSWAAPGAGAKLGQGTG